MDATAQPGAAPGAEQRGGSATSTTGDGPTTKEPQATSVQQEGPVSDAPGPFDALAQRADEAARYKPKGEKPEVVAPDIHRRRKVRDSTDKVLAQAFFDRYRHLFATSNKELWVWPAIRAQAVSTGGSVPTPDPTPETRTTARFAGALRYRRRRATRPRPPALPASLLFVSPGTHPLRAFTYVGL